MQWVDNDTLFYQGIEQIIERDITLVSFLMLSVVVVEALLNFW